MPLKLSGEDIESLNLYINVNEELGDTYPYKDYTQAQYTEDLARRFISETSLKSPASTKRFWELQREETHDLDPLILEDDDLANQTSPEQIQLNKLEAELQEAKSNLFQYEELNLKKIEEFKLLENDFGSAVKSQNLLSEGLENLQNQAFQELKIIYESEITKARQKLKDLTDENKNIENKNLKENISRLNTLEYSIEALINNPNDIESQQAITEIFARLTEESENIPVLNEIIQGLRPLLISKEPINIKKVKNLTQNPALASLEEKQRSLYERNEADAAIIEEELLILENLWEKLETVETYNDLNKLHIEEKEYELINSYMENALPSAVETKKSIKALGKTLQLLKSNKDDIQEELDVIQDNIGALESSIKSLTEKVKLAKNLPIAKAEILKPSLDRPLPIEDGEDLPILNDIESFNTYDQSIRNLKLDLKVPNNSTDKINNLLELSGNLDQLKSLLHIFTAFGNDELILKKFQTLKQKDTEQGKEFTYYSLKFPKNNPSTLESLKNNPSISYNLDQLMIVIHTDRIETGKTRINQLPIKEISLPQFFQDFLKFPQNDREIDQGGFTEDQVSKFPAALKNTYNEILDKVLIEMNIKESSLIKFLHEVNNSVIFKLMDLVKEKINNAGNNSSYKEVIKPRIGENSPGYTVLTNLIVHQQVLTQLKREIAKLPQEKTIQADVDQADNEEPLENHEREAVNLDLGEAFNLEFYNPLDENIIPTKNSLADELEESFLSLQDTVEDNSGLTDKIHLSEIRGNNLKAPSKPQAPIRKAPSRPSTIDVTPTPLDLTVQLETGNATYATPLIIESWEPTSNAVYATPGTIVFEDTASVAFSPDTTANYAYTTTPGIILTWKTAATSSSASISNTVPSVTGTIVTSSTSVASSSASISYTVPAATVTIVTSSTTPVTSSSVSTNYTAPAVSTIITGSSTHAASGSASTSYTAPAAASIIITSSSTHTASSSGASIDNAASTIISTFSGYGNTKLGASYKQFINMLNADAQTSSFISTAHTANFTPAAPAIAGGPPPPPAEPKAKPKVNDTNTLAVSNPTMAAFTSSQIELSSVLVKAPLTPMVSTHRNIENSLYNVPEAAKIIVMTQTESQIERPKYNLKDIEAAQQASKLPTKSLNLENSFKENSKNYNPENNFKKADNLNFLYSNILLWTRQMWKMLMNRI